VRNVGLIVLLLVLVFPALEIYTMFQVADVIGWWLLAWLLASALLGSALIRKESMAAVGRLAMTVQSGHSPFVAIWHSGRTILAGLLLIFPGVISDAIAVILLLWPGRAVRAGKRPVQDDGIIEGEAYVVEAEKIEIKSKLDERSN
jgi:UPF0716 protein FxsA